MANNTLYPTPESNTDVLQLHGGVGKFNRYASHSKSRMKNHFHAICLSMSAIFTIGDQVMAQDTSFAQVEQVGREVSEMISAGAQFDVSKFDNYKSLKPELDELSCAGVQYNYYRVKDVVYMIGTSREGVVMGRNARFNAVANHADIDSISTSTEACLVIPNNPGSLGLTVTHLLSDSPTEFHVIASLVSGKTVFISTKSGIWKVTDGKISSMQHNNI